MLAKASDRDTIRALRIAWDLRNPVIGNDPALAKRVYADAQVNRLMDGNLSLAVANLLKPREWIPAESTLFSVIPVTFEPTPSKIVVVPAPVPELMTVPAGLKFGDAIVNAPELLASKTMLPALVTVARTVNGALPDAF